MLVSSSQLVNNLDLVNSVFWYAHSRHVVWPIMHTLAGLSLAC